MMKAKYYMPTKITIGRGCIKENSALIEAWGQRALIVTGRSSSKRNGSLDDICNVLGTQGISYEIFERVESNPSIQTVKSAAEHAAESCADFIIGIGGGSPMDVAKAVAILATNNIGEEELLSSKFTKKPLPVIAVPTTAGSGSEVTPYSLITNDAIQSKTAIVSEYIYPSVAFLDASYTEVLPRHITINTAFDALSHAVEGFLSVRSSDISSFIALESMKILGECLQFLRSGSIISFQIRERLLYASMLAGIVIGQTGTTAVHAMGYSLTYFKNIDHGRANALLICEYLKFIQTYFEDMVCYVILALGLKDIEELNSLIDGLLNEKEKLSSEEIEKFATIAIKVKNTQFTLKKPNQNDLEEILRKSLT
jgi:alcohol dehydrogenase class IV